MCVVAGQALHSGHHPWCCGPPELRPLPPDCCPFACGEQAGRQGAEGQAAQSDAQERTQAARPRGQTGKDVATRVHWSVHNVFYF